MKTLPLAFAFALLASRAAAVQVAPPTIPALPQANPLPSVSAAAPVTEFGESAAGPFPFKYAITRTPGSANRDVVYFLHGGGGSERSWADGSAEFDGAWAAAGQDAPVVISVSFGKLWALAGKNAGPMSGLLDHFVDRAMPAVEAKLGAPVERRLAFGHSMGALNAIVLAQKRPRLFSRVIAASPALLELSPHAPRSEWQAYADKLGVSLDQMLGIIELAATYFPDDKVWRDFNPLDNGRRMGPRTPPLYVSDGDRDVFFAASRAFAALAASKAVDATWAPLSGDHGTIDVAAIARLLVP